MGGLSPLDPNSFSRPDLAIVTELKFNLTVDFKNKILHGDIDLHVQKIDPDVTEIILDSKELKIQSITEVDLEKPLNYEIGSPVDGFGSALKIELPPKPDNAYIVNIEYETSNKADGLQWLDPEMTAGKKFPYMFSQFQPIHGRSVIPCQDTPYVKTPYTALITVPKDLTAVMSAPISNRDEEREGLVYFFVQNVPVPTYLIALAVGALESKKIGPRSHVWAEKEFLEEAVKEFEDTEKQLKTAEDICGPYVWEIYDLLVLPPSFPFGGMENPCLTFVTPTLLAGDKSLANVIAHEIAHSWTGNLITNRNFEHFWLNEGFTVFIERKIVGRLTSPQMQDFEALCGTSELEETIDHLGEKNPLTCLVVNLENVHPDDSFSKVPYEKGHTFLRYLEIMVGGPDKFEPFLREYFDTYKYKSIDTNDFKSYFEDYFESNHCIKNIDWDAWLYKPGMPPVIPKYDDTLMVVCLIYKQRWIDWDENDPVPFHKSDAEKLNPSQTIQLLQEILDEPPQPIWKLKIFEKIFNLNNITNAEIKFRWLRIGIKSNWEEKIHLALEWINVVGRMKYVRPLYRTLYSLEKARQDTIDNFLENRRTMMHVVAYTVAKDLNINH